MKDYDFYLLKCYCAAALLLCGPSFLLAQPIMLTDCGQPYVDPQDGNNASSAQNRDTLLFTTYFAEAQQQQAYIVDVNAFGGQQVDRVEVQGIMPDSSLKVLGTLSFGNCVGCLDGFALVDNDSLIVSGVSDVNTMDMWLQALGQPEFALPGNLQTLSGVGRISGIAPFCAIGLQVQYSVYSDPNNASTEFSTYIHCPEPVSDCSFNPIGIPDCSANAIYFFAGVPAGCFAEEATLEWTDAAGNVVGNGLITNHPFEGNQGWYYFTAVDDCCSVRDSFLVTDPEFADAGPDQSLCNGTAFSLSGSGGQGHFWTLPDGTTTMDSVYQTPGLSSGNDGAYVLHAFNEDGCEDLDTMSLQVLVPPTPQVSASAACLGDTVFLMTQNDTLFQNLQWVNPYQVPMAFPFVTDFEVTDIGDYSLTATDLNGCNITVPLFVTANPLPEPELVVEETCDTAYAYFYPPGLNFEWPDGSGNQLATATGVTYVVTVTDSVGCALDWMVEIPEPDGPEVQLYIEQPICPGELGEVEIELHSSERQAIFSIDGGESYTLSSRFRDLTYGNYTLVIRDALDCIQEFPIEIIRPDTLGVSLDYAPIEVRPTTPISLTANTVGNVQRLQWVPDEIDTGQPTTDFIATRNLDIRVIVEDGRGCLASAALPLTVVLGQVYGPTAFSPNGDGINDRLILYSDGGSGEIVERFQVYDRWGGLLFEEAEVPLNDNRYGWDGNRLDEPMNTGTYAYYGIVRYPNGFRRIVKGEVHLIR
jgi:gliding motility-associated-like protein